MSFEPLGFGLEHFSFRVLNYFLPLSYLHFPHSERLLGNRRRALDTFIIVARDPFSLEESGALWRQVKSGKWRGSGRRESLHVIIGDSDVSGRKKNVDYFD